MANSGSNIYGSDPTGIAERCSSDALGMNDDVRLDIHGRKDSRVKKDGSVDSGETVQGGEETIKES